MTDVATSAFCVTLVVLYVATISWMQSPVIRVHEMLREAWDSFSYGSSGHWDLTVKNRIFTQRHAFADLWACIFALLAESYILVFFGLKLAYPDIFTTPLWKDTHIGGLVFLGLALRCPGRLDISPMWQSRLRVVLTLAGATVLRYHLPKPLKATNIVASTAVALFADDPWFAIRARLCAAPLVLLLDCSRDDMDWKGLEPVFTLINEVLCTLFSSFILLQGQSLLYKREVFAMDLEDQLQQRERRMQEAKSLLSAVRRLLAVTCDCCEELAQNWEIIWPSRAIWDLLRLPGSWEDHALQLALPFLDFICEEDHQRFADFTSQSHRSEAPSALHLRMKDANGSSFDVQIFHVNVGGAEENVDSGLQKEAKHLIGISLLHPRDSACTTSPKHIDPGGDPSPFNLSDVPSFAHMDRAERSDLDVASMSLVVDLMTCTECNEVGYGVRSLEVTFKEKVSKKLTLPRLFDWIAQKDQAKVEDWIQEHANSWYRQDDCSESCSDIEVQLPGFGNFKVGLMSADGISYFQVQKAAQGAYHNCGTAPFEYQLFMKIDMKGLKSGARQRDQRQVSGSSSADEAKITSTDGLGR